jgi:hypothetical protein
MTFSLPAAALAALALFVTVGPIAAATAPVRCHAGGGTVVAMICGSPEYLAIDREIAALTDRGMAQFSRPDRARLAQSELRYFHQRQGCAWASHHSAHPGAAMDECLRASMEGRVRALRAMVDRGRF